MIREFSYSFSKDSTPVARVAVGETVSFATQDCFSGGICSESDLTDNFNYDRANPATGPVYVEGAEPGDILVVSIKSITVGEQGVVTTLPEVGPLHDRMETRTKVFKVENGHVQFNDLTLKLNPMIGVIGVAPGSGSVPCGFPGSHGGNLDCKLVTENSRMYLPVRAPGALFQVGDLHALMGDGELCGTGLEIAGTVTVTFELLKARKLDWPVLETNDGWHVLTADLNYTTALVEASRQMQTLMIPAYGWDATDVYLYLSLEGDVGVNQGCQPCPVPMVLRLSIPKKEGKHLFNLK